MELSPTTTFSFEDYAEALLEDLLEEGEDRDEMEAFIEEHGHESFYNHFDEYRDLMLEDEINIGYDVEEDDLPDQYDDESYIDGLLTTGFHAVDASEMFGEEVVGYSLY